MTGRARVAALALVGVICVLCLCGGAVAPLQVVLYLAGGWAFFLARVTREIRVDWPDVGLAAIAICAFSAGMHWWLRWLYRSLAAPSPKDDRPGAAGGSRVWRVRWTAAVVSLLLLMFVAGTSMVGIVHQVVWMLTDESPIFESGGAISIAGRVRSRNNLKQIGIGFHMYHDQNGTFPPGGRTDSRGVLLHGWQTMLLPYVEQAALYEQIDRQAPWNAASNRRVFQTRIPLYEHPLIKTRFGEQSADGYAPSHYAANALVVGPSRSLDLDAIEDGAASTIMSGEVSERIRPWGYPANWRDPRLGINRSPEGFGGPYDNGSGAQFVMADGSVQFISGDVDTAVLEALATPDGGEPVGEY